MKNLIGSKRYFYAMALFWAIACLSACSGSKEKSAVYEEEASESQIAADVSESESPQEIHKEMDNEETKPYQTEISLEEFQAVVEKMAAEAAREEAAQENYFDRNRAEEAFAKVNEQRTANGIAALIWDEALYELACIRAQEIVTSFSHQRPDGSYVGDVMIRQYGASGCGENIASNYKSITNLINGWMNSQGHKENMLNSRFTAGVMGCYYHDGSYYWVNLFKQ